MKTSPSILKYNYLVFRMKKKEEKEKKETHSHNTNAVDGDRKETRQTRTDYCSWHSVGRLNGIRNSYIVEPVFALFIH